MCDHSIADTVISLYRGRFYARWAKKSSLYRGLSHTFYCNFCRDIAYLTVILRGRAGYELIYITNEAVGRVGYYQLISGKSEKNNCFSKFSSNSLDFIG